MSRKSALLLSKGGYFHVFNRGVNRERIFYTESGYQLFTGLIEGSLRGGSITLLAYCLMPNHFHLVLRQNDQKALSGFMKSVCEPYAKALNAWLRRKGHVFEGSYALRLIEDPSYLISVSTYVHLNPVEAHMVDNPLSWKHSSCRTYCGLTPSGFVDTEIILSQTAGTKEYAMVVRKGMEGYGESIAKYMIDGGS